MYTADNKIVQNGFMEILSHLLPFIIDLKGSLTGHCQRSLLSTVIINTARSGFSDFFSKEMSLKKCKSCSKLFSAFLQRQQKWGFCEARIPTHQK